MKPERWKKIETICQEAMTLRGKERTTYIENSCAGDPDLFEEVKSLLEHEDPDWMEAPLVEVQSSMLFTDEEKAEQQNIGPYRLIRKIGSGGMGHVYLAVRNDQQFERLVALKVIRSGVVSDDILSRFYEERQILATLNHPNIARLFDGGTTADKLPWFAMEFVKGTPVTDYCERHQSTLDERLDLFLEICSAVQYAHQNLIVHRDLKPANILITETGRPKLLDFGIAKLMDFEQSPGVTQYQNRLMTPEYASPEQVRSESISTVSDLYSLGVLLYELLTGDLPYHFDKRTPASIEKTITNQIPVVPSKKENTLHSKGDLDTIILKALKKDQSKRYSSVEQFADDIRRYQKSLPVIAQKDSISYRAGKFFRRHTIGAAASAVIAILVISFATVTYFQALAIEERAIEAENERDRAEQVIDFLVTLFEASDPAQSAGETITAQELLERGSKRIEEELGEQPQMRAEMEHVMGRVYSSLDQLRQAENLVRSSLNTRRELFGMNHSVTATSQDLLAELLRKQGKYRAADSLHRETLSVRNKLFGSTHPDVAASQEHLAWVLHDQGKYEEAEYLYRKALAARRAYYDSAHANIATNIHNLAWVLHDQGKYEEAESLYREALTMRRQLTGEEHPAVAESLNNLGWLLNDQGNLDEAESILREALRLRRKLLGNEHSSVAQTLSTLAQTLRAQRDYDEAEKMYREALTVYRSQLGNEHSYVAGALNNLALILQNKGDLDEAENRYREALDIQRNIHGESHPYVVASMSNLGALIRDRGEFEEAEKIFEDVLSIDRNLYGEDHRYIADDLQNLAELKYQQGKFEQAVPLFEQALEIYSTSLPDKHSSINRASSKSHA
ncbi:MAG: tetratricopeptide repeat protein [Bacteroidetes bacterium]|jgi:serine/threonine-protein kinase|nr:tetratricopeptide repeat protein [Bacteroidota bacterium]